MNNIIYILVAFIVTYAIRVVPLTILRKPIENKFILSFLYYVPFVTLTAMTFPAILSETGNALFGVLALLIGIIIAWTTENLFAVALSCCGTVLIAQIITSVLWGYYEDNWF